MTFKQGCAIELGEYFLITSIYYFVFKTQVSPEFIYFIAPVMGTFGYFFLKGLTAILIPGRELRAISRARKKHHPEEGQLTAVSGPVVALENTLHSPLRGEECVAYDYAIYRMVHQSEGQDYQSKDFRGYAFNPFAIKTSLEKIQIYPSGFSLLEHFEWVDVPSSEARKYAFDYIANTRFVKDPANDLIHSAVSEIQKEMKSHSSRKIDYCSGEELSHNHLFREACLPTGQTVTGIGTYSAAKKGLVWEGITPVQLVQGDLEAARRHFKTNKASVFFMGLLMFIVANGIFAFLLLQGSF